MPAHAADIILEILRATDGEWSGKSRLFKVFYFAHLYYATEQLDSLTDWPIVRMPQGPGIHESHVLLQGLVQSGMMTVETIHEGPYPESRYRLTEQGRATPAASVGEAARRAIRDAVAFCHEKTAAELSQITHERSRSWQLAKDGDILEVVLDSIPDDEYERGERLMNQLDPAWMESTFGGS